MQFIRGMYQVKGHEYFYVIVTSREWTAHLSWAAVCWHTISQIEISGQEIIWQFLLSCDGDLEI